MRGSVVCLPSSAKAQYERESALQSVPSCRVKSYNWGILENLLQTYFLSLGSYFLEFGICLLQLLNCPAVVTAAKSTVGGWKKKNSYRHIGLRKTFKTTKFYLANTWKRSKVNSTVIFIILIELNHSNIYMLANKS